MAQTKFQISNLEEGITLIEIIVVIFIIALFSSIIIANFPEILRQYALSKVTYKLAQDLRKTEDLGLSGVTSADANKQSIAVKGYGIYINLSQPSTQYIIYADVADANGNSDQEYSGNTPYTICSAVNQEADRVRELDCAMEPPIDVSNDNSSLYIKDIKNSNGSNIAGSSISINFMPPNPNIKIIDNQGTTYTQIGIVLGLSSGSSSTRTVWVNTSGLINVQ